MLHINLIKNFPLPPLYDEKTENRVWKTYVLFDPRDPFAMRYAGITFGTLKNRYIKHISRSRKVKKEYCSKWTRKLLKEGVKPEIALFETGKGVEKGFDAEIALIALLKKFGCKLVNTALGGRGCVGYKRTKEQKEVISKNSKKMWENPEIRKAIIEACTGKETSEETRKKLSVGSKKRWEKEEFRKKILDTIRTEAHHKMLVENTTKFMKEHPEIRKQIAEKVSNLWKNEEYRDSQHNSRKNSDKIKKLVKILVEFTELHKKSVTCMGTGQVFSSMKEACDAFGLKSRGAVGDAIRRGRKAGDHYWKYTEDPDPTYKNKRKKAVQCIETGQIFESAVEASLFLGLNKQAISVAISNKYAAGSFHWKYVEGGMPNFKPRCKKPVICIETGQIFESASSASKFIKSSYITSVHAAIKTKTRAGGYHWEYI